MISTTTQRVTVGDTIRIRLPWSEVCLHMRVADQIRPVRVSDHGAQILNDDGTPFSFPITHGEAGIYHRDDGLYIHPPA